MKVSGVIIEERFATKPIPIRFKAIAKKMIINGIPRL